MARIAPGNGPPGPLGQEGGTVFNHGMLRFLGLLFPFGFLFPKLLLLGRAPPARPFSGLRAVVGHGALGLFACHDLLHLIWSISSDLPFQLLRHAQFGAPGPGILLLFCLAGQDGLPVHQPDQRPFAADAHRERGGTVASLGRGGQLTLDNPVLPGSERRSPPAVPGLQPGNGGLEHPGDGGQLVVDRDPDAPENSVWPGCCFSRRAAAGKAPRMISTRAPVVSMGPAARARSMAAAMAAAYRSSPYWARTRRSSCRGHWLTTVQAVRVSPDPSACPGGRPPDRKSPGPGHPAGGRTPPGQRASRPPAPPRPRPAGPPGPQNYRGGR